VTKYTVVDSNGDVLDRGLTVAEAAHIILTDDGREYAIRPDDDGCWTLWSRQQVANKGWSPTVVYSFEDDRDLAESEIFQKVVDSDWPHHPEAMTDEQYMAGTVDLNVCDLESI
jgi:hypothetical protein